MGRALGDYHRGDRADLRSMGSGQLNSTSQVAMEGVAGLFWVGVGAVLLRRSSAGSPKRGPSSRMPPPRR